MANVQLVLLQDIKEDTSEIKAKVDGLPQQMIDLLVQQGFVSAQHDSEASVSLTDLQSIAKKFGQNETLQPAELVGFLTSKAEEYRIYRAEIEAIDERTAGLGNLKAAAQDAADRLDFDEVEMLLSRVDEVETTVAAQTKILRARNALLLGNAEKAFIHFSATADSFAGINEDAPASLRLEFGSLLFSHGLRYGGPGMAFSEKMFRAALKRINCADNSPLWANAQNRLAVTLRNQGSRTEGAKGAALLGEAVKAYRDALEVYTLENHPEYWAMSTQNLAGALLEQGKRTGGATGEALLGETVGALRDALKVNTRENHQLDWAMNTQNLALALKEQGNRTQDAEGAALLGEAVSALRDALEVFTREENPVHWAGATQNLALALEKQGSRTQGTDGAALLGEAVKAYRDAHRVFTCEEHPVHWAMTQENLAILEVARAQHDSCTDPLSHLKRALEHLNKALSVYDPIHMPYDHGTATHLRDIILAALSN